MRISRAAVVLSSIAACAGIEHLSMTSQESVVILPGSAYDFGTTTEYTTKTTSPSPYFTIRAQSSADDDYVESIALGPTCGSDFAVVLSQPLPAEVYCMGGITYGMTPGSQMMTCSPVDYTFDATFTPSNVGPESCDVTVTTMPKMGGSAQSYPPIHLTGVGSATSYAMKVLPTTPLDFGDIALGSDSSDQSITVFNNGGAPIDVTAASTDVTDFLPPVAGTFSLTPGMSKTFDVHCHAGTTPATYSGTTTFTTPAGEGSLTASVSLKCRAVATSVSAQPNPVSLGTHLLGDSPTVVAVVITNIGVGNVTLDSFGFANTPGTEVTYNPAPMSPVTLTGQGSNTTVYVQYAPSSERDVGPLGTMTFHANNQPTNVPLRGGAHSGSISTNPASVDFGTICAGNGSAMDVVVYANAGGDVTVSGPSGPATPFSATLPGTGRTLLAHHGNEITLTARVMTTGATAPGEYNDTIGVGTNIPNQSTVPVAVHAAVLAGGVAPTPAMVHFGPNLVDKPSPVQTVTLTNCGTGALAITDASFTGANGAEFAIVSPADPHVTIGQAGSQTFLVLMTPHGTGAKSAQLVFSYAGGTATVALDGTGYGAGDGGGNKDRETYYACSIGTGGGSGGAPGAVLPIALAAFAARRRRRRARA